MSFARARRLTGVLAVVLAAGAGVAMTSGVSQAHSVKGHTTDIQILSFNDFHGNLEAPSGSSGRVTVDHRLDTSGATPKVVDVTQDAGGVEYLATHLKQARAGHRNTVTVAAGDIIGASPLLSAAFHDEPTIEAMNSLGLDATSVGNHEFDEGYKELQRMQRGGCLPDGDGAANQNSCAAHTFEGADFHYLAANVKYAGTNRTILPPYWVKTFKGGARVGFIGMTLKETPSIVSQAGIQGLQFTDEVQTANALVPVLKRQGVNAIVVLIHQGGTPAVQKWTGPDGKVYNANATYDYACGKGGTLAPDSAILPIAANLSPAIDMVISGHTHQPYVCNVPDPAGQQRLVTSASSFGRLFTETDVKYDLRARDIVRASVAGSNMVVTRDVAKDPAESQIISTYSTLIKPIAEKHLGTISTDVNRVASPAGETPLGDLIADAQVNDPSVVSGGVKPVVAFMNPGGIRADLTYASSPKGEGDGVVTYEEAFTVQPFNNYVVSMNLTGADIYALLQQQWSGANAGPSNTKFLQVSKGFSYAWRTGTAGPEVVPGSVKIGDTVVANDASQTFRVAANNFLSDGGDNFAAFKNGTAKYIGGLDIDSFANYLPTVSPYTPAALDRITKQ
ncbi:MAG: bifunctional metallophosphatase/5'-nucleotidase [Oryzihumus sp.]